ncbi:hypothetical protein pb186bvf_021185 [Paramecium bursaria]
MNQEQQHQYKPHIINTSFAEISPDIPEFFKHKRHVFIMTNAGRPIYVQYGGEIKSAIFLATLNTILQKFLLFYSEDRELQQLFKILNHNVHIYILQRNQICYICATCELDLSELLVFQMLDFLNTQLISIVTDNANSQLQQKPNTDLGFQVGGSRNLLTLAVKNGYSSPCITFNSIISLPIIPSLRQHIHGFLKDIKNSSIVCTLLLTETVVIDVCRQKNMEFKLSDILIIQSMIQGQSQLKKSENWTPACLPGLSAQGFVYAYIYFFHENIGIVMISDDNSLDMFQQCKESAKELIDKFRNSKINDHLSSCLKTNPIIPNCLCSQNTTIRHFIVRHVNSQLFLPVYQPFGQNSPNFMHHLNKYAELYKEFLISQNVPGNQDQKQNYFVWGSDGYGISQYHDVIIMFCFDSLIDLTTVAQNVSTLHKMFRSEELQNFFILKAC